MPSSPKTPSVVVVVMGKKESVRRIVAELKASCLSTLRASQVNVFANKKQDTDGVLESADMVALQNRLYDVVTAQSSRHATAILMPDLECHRFLDALAPFAVAPIVDIAEAVIAGLSARHPPPRSIALLTRQPEDALATLTARFSKSEHRLQIVRVARDAGFAAVQTLLMQAASNGADAAWLDEGVPSPYEEGRSGEFLPPLLDVHAMYARAALVPTTNRAFKVGVVGGVGPAATVSFLDKLVTATPATRDQDHINVVIEQNPQIPDRTAHLVGDGIDPTMALLATCRSLQEDNASVIAIPCNTAHAFVTRIQPALRIPIVHMIVETIRFITSHWPHARTIGLLATDGTIQSGVYHTEAESAGFDILTPSACDQDHVMDLIYGPQGVKAGQISLDHKNALEQVIATLAAEGAQVVILGCTELPLLVPQNIDYKFRDKHVPIIDPTQVLATRCVELARTAKASR